MEAYGRTSEKVVTFVMINEDSNGGPVARGNPGSQWVVQTWQVW
jgi:hypothetical protein